MERGGGGPANGSSSPADIKDNTSSSGNGKGFMRDTGIWLDEVLKPVPEGDRAKVKKLVAGKIYESYKNGCKAK